MWKVGIKKNLHCGEENSSVSLVLINLAQDGFWLKQLLVTFVEMLKLVGFNFFWLEFL